MRAALPLDKLTDCGRDDVLRAVESLKPLGSGFTVVGLGQMIRSIPKELKLTRRQSWKQSKYVLHRRHSLSCVGRFNATRSLDLLRYALDAPTNLGWDHD